MSDRRKCVKDRIIEGLEQGICGKDRIIKEGFKENGKDKENGLKQEEIIRQLQEEIRVKDRKIEELEETICIKDRKIEQDWEKEISLRLERVCSLKRKRESLMMDVETIDGSLEKEEKDFAVMCRRVRNVLEAVEREGSSSESKQLPEVESPKTERERGGSDIVVLDGGGVRGLVDDCEEKRIWERTQGEEG